MGQFDRTQVGTTDPLDICNGVAIFPSLGSFDAGINASSRSKDLVKKNTQILLYKFDIYFFYDLEIGLCGPAWATNMYVEGTADADHLQMTITDDDTAAGFFLGMLITLGLQVTITELVTHVTAHHWHPKVYQTWDTDLRINLTVKFDPIALLYTLITQSMNGGVSSAGSVSGLTSVSMYKQVSDNFSTGNVPFSFEPLLNFPINILPYVPAAGDILDACSDIGASLKSGPQISFGIPISMSIDKVMVENYQYDQLTFENGEVTSTSASEQDSDGKVSLEFKWTPSIDFRVGWFISFSLWSLFNVGANYTVSIIELLGIDTGSGPYSHALGTTVGETLNTAANESDRPTRLARVIFHDPETDQA